jgi:DNA polymerase-3 subunit gamma/tau
VASLYRTHRPQRFGEMVGQEHVTTALRNAILEDRVGHAYLFSGPRGTGKTTTARLLARALNCLDLGADGEPCGVCENCVAIADGSFFDLVELDAASNNGVEAMRDLIQSVHLGVGATARRKVYIVDEVHMLSAAASNTLLKTLEEPPEHVVFVLATTDPHKVLPTIRSRTQHFEFTLLSREKLIGLLTEVLEREGIPSEPEVLDIVAARAAGSGRDALSALDQVLALGGGKLDTQAVLVALGGAPFDLRVAVLQSAFGEDVAGALAGVHDMLTQGHDVRRVADDLLRTLRDAFMVANAGARVPYEGPVEEAERLAVLAKDAGNAALTRAMEILGQTIVDIRQQTVADPRLVLEVAVVRIARREARTQIETLLDRVERLERQLANGGVTPAAPAAAPAPAVAAPATPAARPATKGPMLAARATAEPKAAPVSEPAADAPAPEAVAPAEPPSFELDDIVVAWPKVLDSLAAPLRAVIQVAQPITIERGAVVFGVPTVRLDATKKRFQDEADTIRGSFRAQLGFEPRFMLRGHNFDTHDALAPPDGAPPPDEPPDEPPIDLSELVDAPPEAAAPSSLDLLKDGLGAEVVEERKRDS